MMTHREKHFCFNSQLQNSFITSFTGWIQIFVTNIFFQRLGIATIAFLPRNISVIRKQCNMIAAKVSSTFMVECILFQYMRPLSRERRAKKEKWILGLNFNSWKGGTYLQDWTKLLRGRESTFLCIHIAVCFL